MSYYRGNACRFAPALLGALLILTGSLDRICKAQTYLYNRADYAVGNSPSAVVAADFNGDGIPDLAVVNENDNTLSILLGNPGSTFARHVDYPTGRSPSGLVVADFNGDGKADLAVVGLECTGSPCPMFGVVSILLGNGDGTFQRHTDYSYGNGQSDFVFDTNAIVTADFNGDGKADVAVLDRAENLVAVLFGNGDGTLQSQQTFSVGNNPTALTLGDFNGDGKPDLITSNVGSATLSVLLNNGGATFSRIDSAVSESPLSQGFSALVVGDFDNDGKLDAIATDAGGGQLFMKGNGDGTFRLCPLTAPCQMLSLGTTAHSMLAIDLNHDGKLDLIASGGMVAVYLGNGDGTFQPPVLNSLGVSATSIALADVNGDGQFDLVATDAAYNSVDVMLGTGTGLFGAISTVDLGTDVYGPSAAVAADFNGDGKTDLAVAEPGFPYGQIALARGNGDGTFRNPIYSPLVTEGINTNLMFAGDFNADGKPDLVLLDPYGRGFGVLLGNGDGSFQTPVETAFPASSGFQGFAVGDFSGDGKTDIAVTSNGGVPSNPVLTIYLSNGDGSFRVGAQYAVNFYASVVAADFNGDGKLDLAVTGFGDALEVFLGNGDGTFSAPMAGPSAIYNGVPVAADFNGDGKLDLVVGTYSGVGFLAGNGDGTFRNIVYSDSNYTLASFWPGDFNGDGKLDVVGRPPSNLSVGGVVVLLGNGDGTFQSPVTFSFPGSFTSGPLAGDFNGDGVSDLALPNTSLAGSSSVATLYLSSPVAAVFPRNLTFPHATVGETSGDSPYPVTLSNSGNAPLKIAGMSVSGDFSAAPGTCGTTLAIGAACEELVNFNPTATGTRTGGLTVTDNAIPGTQTVSLAGVGIRAVVTLSAASLNFSSQALGTTSSPQSVLLTNNGNATLSIGSIGSGGDFAQTNTCVSSVGVGANCAINVTFTPTAAGSRTGSITITDNAGNSPQTVSLTGTGTGPAVGLSAPLSFPAQLVGTPSSSQTVTLTNTGNASLTLTALAATGPFAVATSGTTCSTSTAFAASGTCTVAVTFTPTAGGAASGGLSFTDNAPNSPQTVALTGTGQDFTITVPPTTPTTATVTPGQAASYPLSLSGLGGISQTINFSCTGAPTEATCTVNPPSATPSASGTVSFTVNITTTAATVVAPHPRRTPPLWPGMNVRIVAFLLLGLLALAMLSFAFTGRKSQTTKLRWALGTTALATLALAMAACSGGGGGGGVTHDPGTPAGTYALTVTGTVAGSASLQHSTTLTLKVN